MRDIFIIRCKILLVFIARYLNIQNLYIFFYTVKDKKMVGLNQIQYFIAHYMMFIIIVS